MNLPALSIDFLYMFNKFPIRNLENNPHIHLYTFQSIKNNEKVEDYFKELIEKKICKIDFTINDIHVVKKVSSSKTMYCVSL